LIAFAQSDFDGTPAFIQKRFYQRTNTLTLFLLWLLIPRFPEKQKIRCIDAAILIQVAAGKGLTGCRWKRVDPVRRNLFPAKPQSSPRAASRLLISFPFSLFPFTLSAEGRVDLTQRPQSRRKEKMF